MTQNVFCPSVILSRNEQQPPCRKRPGPWWFHWPHHTQKGTTQVQAEADPHIQEQGPQARPEGVKKKKKTFILINVQNNQMITHQELTTHLFACSSPALVTISPAWRVLAQTSQWCAHGRPSATWSSATWPNTASSKPAASCLPCLPAPLLRLTLSSLTSIHLGSARHDKAAGAPPNALSSIYLRLHSTKWKESIMMLLFLYYYYYYMIMLCMYIYILEMRRREKELLIPFSLSLHRPTTAHSCPLPPPHPDLPLSLLNLGNGRKQNTS